MTCRVVHMTSVHYPFDTRIFHKECKSLALAGYNVTLIAAHAQGDLQENGVKLRAVAPPHGRSERLTRTMLAVYRAALDEDAEIYHFHDPELMPVGLLLKMAGKKVIYDVHEDFAGAMDGKEWIPAFLHRPAAMAMNACESMLGGVFDRVIVATPTIGLKFRSRTPSLVQNFPWKDELVVADAPPYDQREPIGIYVGWLGDGRGMLQMSQAVELAARELPIKLLIGGKVIPGAVANFDKNGSQPWVEYLGFLDRPQVARLMARARFGVVTFLPGGNTTNAQPTKLYEYMAGSLPVIASDFPVYRKVVDSAGCGLLVDPSSPSAIAEAMLWLLRNPLEAAEMGQRGRRAVMEKYSWENEARTLVATYSQLHTAQ